MKAPTHLQHKPVVTVDDYASKDGIHKGNTDAEALSIGYAQYDDTGTTFSAKIFRHTGNSWSRQSEEMPLHRALDLAILLAGVIKRSSEDEPSFTSLAESVVSSSGFADLKRYLSDPINVSILQPRLDELKRLL
jgi:hypothetical protein